MTQHVPSHHLVAPDVPGAAGSPRSAGPLHRGRGDSGPWRDEDEESGDGDVYDYYRYTYIYV